MAKYTVTHFIFPNAIEGEAMDNESKDFNNKKEAVNYMYECSNNGIYFAGASLENTKNGNRIAYLSDNGDFIEY